MQAVAEYAGLNNTIESDVEIALARQLHEKNEVEGVDYWEPAGNIETILVQMNKAQLLEIPRTLIQYVYYIIIYTVRSVPHCIIIDTTTVISIITPGIS